MREERWNREKFRDFHGYLYTVNNGTMDVEGFIDSPYGRELADRLETRFAIEDDREAAARYYASIGLNKEYHEYEDYYARWTLLVPMKPKSEKLPLVFWLHGGGNSLEAEENMTGFAQIAAREAFMLACPQNTNPEKVFEIIEAVAAEPPLDRSRIYLAGFSQGAAQTHGAYFRRPELFAAVVTSGNDVWQPWDNFNVRYTAEEIEKVRALRMPLMQMCGQCEPFPYSPLNTHKRHGMLAGNFWGRPDTFSNVGKDDDLDPTRIHDLAGGRFDPVFGKASEHKWRMADHYEPPEDADPGRWNLERVNYRLGLLGCPPRNVEECMSFLTIHDDELRRIAGIYGDYEAVEYHYGYRHYTVGVNDGEGREMYRFVVVQNSPHWPQLAIGELGWQFMKRFSRRTDTGELEIGG